MSENIHNLLNALSWTLVHSVWQGLIMAILAAVFLAVSAKASAALRYNVLGGLLAVFAVAIFATFLLEFGLFGNAVSFSPGAAHGASVSIVSVEALQSSAGFIDRNVMVLISVWFAVFCVKCFGIFQGFTELYRLRNRGTSAVSAQWEQRLLELQNKLGIVRHVTLLESRLAAVPCAYGILKPIILIPAGLISSLPYDQIEAILLHELAHIKRRDFAMNLLQTFLETIFFFNPAVLWLGSVIREERENCCDDLALSVSNDRTSLVRALLSVNQVAQTSVLSAAFTGRRNTVLKRVQRILGVGIPVMDRLEKGLVALSVVVFSLVAMACSDNFTNSETSQTAEVEQLPDDMEAYERDLLQDLMAEGVVADTVGLSYRLSRTDFIVNGETQPEEVHLKFKAKYLKYKNISATFRNWTLD